MTRLAAPEVGLRRAAVVMVVAQGAVAALSLYATADLGSGDSSTAFGYLGAAALAAGASMLLVVGVASTSRRSTLVGPAVVALVIALVLAALALSTDLSPTLLFIVAAFGIIDVWLLTGALRTTRAARPVVSRTSRPGT